WRWRRRIFVLRHTDFKDANSRSDNVDFLALVGVFPTVVDQLRDGDDFRREKLLLAIWLQYCFGLGGQPIPERKLLRKNCFYTSVAHVGWLLHILYRHKR